MEVEFSVPTLEGQRSFSAGSGSSVIFVGANGGGKTRLAVFLEQKLAGKAHRVSAHRALSLNPKVSKISEEQSLLGLRIGNISPQFVGKYELRDNFRWGRSAATALLNDFDFIVQALFAEQSNRALETHNSARAGTLDVVAETKFERLAHIWEDLLPHRKLHVTGDDILVSAAVEKTYSAAEMSDGERAVFYLIGQTLIAAPDSVLIVDEPELHLHRSIMSKLWDALEAARKDCVFVYITHDLEFASLRHAQKFVIRSYDPQPVWDLEGVPNGSGFSEELTTLILGSRSPILFVEGDGESMDVQIYRALYPQWTVVPRGSCADVIHAVRTLRNGAMWTRIDCAGFVDCDGLAADEVAALGVLGVSVLPVAEIESIFLLPDVAREIAVLEGHQGTAVDDVVARLVDRTLVFANDDGKIEHAAVRFCKRRIDRLLKILNLTDANDIEGLKAEFTARTQDIDIASLAEEFKAQTRSAIAGKDLSTLLRLFDNKGLFGVAASELKGTSAGAFRGWLSRTLASKHGERLAAVVRGLLPQPRLSADGPAATR